MSEGNQEEKISLKKKFVATRYALERVLFDEEKPKVERKSQRPVIGLGIIILAEAVMLALWLAFQKFAFVPSDVVHVEIIKKLYSSISGGDFAVLMSPYSAGIKKFAPPLYYLTYIPFLKISGSLKFAMFCVNTLYFSIIAFSLYSLVKGRKVESGWIAAAFAGALPFVLDLLRKPDPMIAAVAFACAAYTVFILSHSFEKGRFSGFFFGVFTACGLMSHKFFIFYCLPPLVPFLSYIISFERERILGGFLFLIVFAGLWYVKNAFYYFLSYSFVGGKLIPYTGFSVKNFFWFFPAALNSMHIIMFLIGIVCLLWMYLAVFNPYDGRKPVLIWVFLPSIFFSFFFEKNPSYLFPSIIAISAAVGVMTPRIIYRHMLALCAFFLVINQSGFLSTKKLPFFGGIPFIGLPETADKSDRSKKIFQILKNSFGERDVVVAVTGNGEEIDFLNFYADENGIKNFRFRHFPSSMLTLADAAICCQPDKLKKECCFANDRWLRLAFLEKKDKLLNNNGIRLFIKKPLSGNFKEGTYRFNKFFLGGLYLQDAKVKLMNFDKEKKVFKKAFFSASYASFDDVDMYKVQFFIKNFAFVTKGKSLRKIIPLKAQSVKLLSAKITNYSMARYLERENRMFSNIDIEFRKNNLIQILAEWKGKNVFLEWKLERKKDNFKFSLNDFVLVKFNPPAFLLSPFEFEYSLKNLPVYISFPKIRFAGAMLEIGG